LARFEERRVFSGRHKAIGTFGEIALADRLKGERVKSNKHGHDVKVGADLYEVKSARESFTKTNVKWTWSQIRIDKAHTHIALLAVSPSRVRGVHMSVAQLHQNKLLTQHSNASLQLKLSEAQFHSLYVRFKL
jgi:hypothetical protein